MLTHIRLLSIVLAVVVSQTAVAENGRIWTLKGTRIEATLVDWDQDYVTLKIPVNALSETDLAYLEEIRADVPPILRGAPCYAMIKKKMPRLRKEAQRYETASIVGGRVVLEGKGDPQDVIAQMEIFQGGYFITVVSELNRPLCFRMHQYVPLDVEFKETGEDMIDLGTLHMNPLDISKLSCVKGKLNLDCERDISKAQVSFNVQQGPINTPSGGYEPRRHWPAPIKAKVESDGSFTATGFSPMTYSCRIQAPGYVYRSMSIDFKEKEYLDLGTVFLEKQKEIFLEYIVSSEPKFDINQTRNITLHGGDRWKAMDGYGYDLNFGQEKGRILFDYSYAPCYLADMGIGDLDDFTGQHIQGVAGKEPHREKAKNGHVYLLRQEHLKRWVLFKITVK